MAKVYLSVPLIKNRDLALAQRLADAIKASGNELTSPWVVSEDPNQGLDEAGVFKRDVEAVKQSDAVLAEVSVPSHGVGMELFLAGATGKRVICVYKRGTKLSRMVKGMPRAVLIEYEHVQDLEQKLLPELRAL